MLLHPKMRTGKCLLLLLSVLLCLLLAGCTSTYYTDAQSEKIAAEGGTLITDYLDSRYDDYQLLRCDMVTGAKVNTNPYAGYYASDYVEGFFAVGAERYTIVVNIRTGDLYSDEQRAALCDYMKEELRPYIAEAGYEADFIVDNIQLEYRLLSEGVQSGKQTLDTEISLTGVIPVEYDAASFDELFSTDNTAGDFYRMSLLFHEEEKGQFPHEALTQYCAEHPFFDCGTIYVYNLNEADFNDILSGKKPYHYSMEKTEEYSVLPGDSDAEPSDPTEPAADASLSLETDENGYAVVDGVILAYLGTDTETTTPLDAVSIGTSAFSSDYGCGEHLERVRITGNIKTIEDGAFSFTAADELYLEEGVETIGHAVFSDSYINDIWFPASVTKIGAGIMETEEGLRGCTIHVVEGSAAARYFEANMPYGEAALAYDYQ